MILEIVDIDKLFNKSTVNFIIVLIRVSSMVMLLPGIGDALIPSRVKIIFSVLLSVILLHVVPLNINYSYNLIEFVSIIISEVIIGIFIGMISRIVLSAVHVAGMIIAYQSGLSSAMLFDANQGTQNALFGIFLTILSIVLIFITDLHHQMLIALVDTYIIFPVGNFPVMADIAKTITEIFAYSFAIGVKMSMPFIIFGLLLFLGSGILNRVMPTMQVFFVIMPMQILISFAIFAFVFSSIIMWYINHSFDIMRPWF